MKKPQLKLRSLLSILVIFILFFPSIALACCSTTERVEVPACFLIDNEPKVKEGLEGAKTLVPELTNSFQNASAVVPNIDGLISGAGGNTESAASAITLELDNARTNYNDLREKLGTRKGAEDTSEGPAPNSLIGKLREVFDRYKVKKDGEFQKRLTECEQLVNSFARTVSIQRSLLRKLKSEEAREVFKSVTEITNNLLEHLIKCVENIDLSVNGGVCLWEVADDITSDTSVDPKSDVKKKRLPVGTKVRTKAKEREVTNDLNSELKDVTAKIASPDQCKFHHIHGVVKSKEDPDGPFCGHGSVINTDIECPNCPKIEVGMVVISETVTERQCVLFKEIVEASGMATAERDPRLQYQQWVKELICTYLETDFTSEVNIETFAGIAFEAFKKNIPTLISPDQNIIHIVARNPAVIDEETGKPELIKSPTTKRSNFQEGKSCVGITRNIKDIPLFNKSKPAKNEKEQRELIPVAENAIVYLFLLNKTADIFSKQTNEQLKLIKDKVSKDIQKATDDFKKEFLKVSKVTVLLPTLTQLGNLSSTTGGESMIRDDTNNLNANDFFVDVGLTSIKQKTGGKEVKVEEFKPSEIPAGDALGITIPLTVILQPRFASVTSTESGDLESIEPLEKLSGELRLKKTIAAVVRTSINIRAAFGRPVCQCFKDGKPVGKPGFNCMGECNVVAGIRIVSNDGKRDLTELIKNHELTHVNDTFNAFKEKFIGGVKERLNDTSLDSFVVEKKLRIEINPVDDGRRAIDIIATYILNKDAKVEEFKKKINSLFVKEEIKKISAAFKTEKDKKSDAFHATPQGQGLTGEEGVTVDTGTLDPLDGKPIKPPK